MSKYSQKNREIQKGVSFSPFFWVTTFLCIFISARMNRRCQTIRNKESDLALRELRIVKEITQAMIRKQDPRSVVQGLAKGLSL